MSRLSPSPLARSTWSAALLTILGIFVSPETRAASNWPSSLTRDPRGSFPDLRSARATYVYGWSGIAAATSDVYFHRRDQQTFVLEGRGRTVSLARVLWRFDLDYRSAANAETLRPLDTHQVETVRGKRVETNLKFSDEGEIGRASCRERG